MWIMKSSGFQWLWNFILHKIILLEYLILYGYWWNTRIFPFNKKSYPHYAPWRYYFYLSHVRILVLSWLLTWLANYKRASCSGTLPVLLKFHSQNGFKMQRRYSYQWLSMSCQIFTSKFFKHVERLVRFAEVSESDVEKFIAGEENANTKQKTIMT